MKVWIFMKISQKRGERKKNSTSADLFRYSKNKMAMTQLETEHDTKMQISSIVRDGMKSLGGNGNL
ncbi:MAG: hypothetical protein NPIRA05_13620 [Nitrospirales bacterium]|nr:MAG: hypothetical protein NPIRA05_13620 [Nitrospirales bacterium]